MLTTSGGMRTKRYSQVDIYIHLNPSICLSMYICIYFPMPFTCDFTAAEPSLKETIDSRLRVSRVLGDLYEKSPEIGGSAVQK